MSRKLCHQAESDGHLTFLKFSNSGGIMTSAPSEGLNNFLSNYADRIIKEPELNTKIIDKYFLENGIRFNGLSGGVLYHHRRVLSDGQLLFMVNSSLSDYLTGSVDINGAGVVEMNTLTGGINGYPWNHSVQFKTNIVDRDTFGLNTGFTATYHFTIKGSFDFTSLKAVVERPDLWSISVNGTEVKPEAGKWWLDREFRVLDISSQVKAGENSVTLNASPMKIHAEI